MSIYEEMVARYESGETPWDDELPPPEVIDLLATLSPGRALDLGCGAGRAAIYMASKGWDVDAIDFVPQAIDTARERAAKAGVQPRFHCTSVTELGFLTGPYTFALDVGCCHALTPDQLIQYRDHLKRLIALNGYYLLFARVKNRAGLPNEEERGLVLETVKTLFEDGFRLEKMETGVTKTDETQSWNSAWLWFRRFNTR